MSIELLTMIRDAHAEGNLTHAAFLERQLARLKSASGDDDDGDGGDTDDVPPPKKTKKKSKRAKSRTVSRHGASPLVLSDRDTPKSASYFASVFGGAETVEQVIDDATVARMKSRTRERAERASLHHGVSEDAAAMIAKAERYGHDVILHDAKAACAAAKARALSKIKTSNGGAW